MLTPALAAGWFLPFVVPIAIYVAWSDLATMKIPNIAVVALFAVFVLVGPFVLPFEDWLWRFGHLAVMLLAGMALNALGLMGAGDAKFIAAAAPFVALGDLWPVALILSGCLVAGWVTHRLAKVAGLNRLAPGWKSWTSGRRFPMGFPLALGLVVYLSVAVLG